MTIVGYKKNIATIFFKDRIKELSIETIDEDREILPWKKIFCGGSNKSGENKN